MAEAAKGGWSRRARAGCDITRPAAWRSATVSAGSTDTSVDVSSSLVDDKIVAALDLKAALPRVLDALIALTMWTLTWLLLSH